MAPTLVAGQLRLERVPAPVAVDAGEMSVAAVRHRLRLDAPPNPARSPDLVPFAAWSIAALVVWVSPLALLLGVLWLGLRSP